MLLWALDQHLQEYVFFSLKLRMIHLKKGLPCRKEGYVEGSKGIENAR